MPKFRDFRISNSISGQPSSSIMTPHFTVAIVGRPNVGKSRLFNRLIGKRISIVHDMPGVTRDILTHDMDEGYTLMDTGGMGLVAACDVAVASQETKFCLSEVKIGLIPATIGPYIVAAMGTRQARRYMLSAERFSATDAQRTGLVHEVVDLHSLDEMVLNFVQLLKSGGTSAHKETKSLVELIGQSSIDEHLISETADWIARVRASDEGREGIKSFLEKRKPSWISED